MLSLVDLFLIGQHLLLIFLITDPALEFLEKLLDLISCDLRLVNHKCSLLSQRSQSRHDFFEVLFPSLLFKAESSPVLRFFRLGDRHVKVRGGLASS